MFSIPRITGVNVQDTEHSDKPDPLSASRATSQRDEGERFAVLLTGETWVSGVN